MLGKPAVAALFFALAAPALAQEEPPPGVVGGPLVVETQGRQIDPERAAAMAQRMEETAARLDLTDAQREQVRPVFQDSMMQSAQLLQAARAGGRPSLGELRRLRGELQAIDDATHAQLEGILSPEQLDELSTIQDENREQLRARLREQRANSSP